MDPQGLAEHIRNELGERVLDTSVAYDQLTVTVTPEAFPQAARFCKTDDALDMRFFDFLSGVDEREEGFSVVARLYSHVKRHAVLLKVMVPGGRDAPRLPTLTDVYRGADWHERETYDMFGIVFEGHPGLLPRILTVENFEGWPLRKDFVLASREVKPWPGAKEPAEEGSEEGAGGTAAATPGTEPEDRAAAAKAKAERAKKKAAEARARKAAEKAAAMSEESAAAMSEETAAAMSEETAAAMTEETPGDAEEPTTDD